MDKSALIIPMPKLSDEAAAGFYNALLTFMEAVESHYFYQLRQYYRSNSKDDDVKDIV